MNDSEMRLQEIEGVLFGISQVMALVIATHPNQPLLRASARKAAAGVAVVGLNSGLADFALEQAEATFHTLFGLPPPSATKT